MATPAAILSILVKADGIAKTQTQVSNLDKSLERTSKRGAKHLGALKLAAGALAGVAAFETLKKGVGAAIGEFEEARKVGAQTTAVLKSTGSAAGVTAKHIQDLAGAISKKAGIDDEAIQSGENLLLTFTKVRNEAGKGNKIFDRATQIAVDMSVALGQDLKSSNIQLGKALNDPIKGVTALQRVGVSFTQKQKDQIKGLVEHGKTLDAQKLILKELTTEFGGSAAAQATASDKMKVALGNLAEAVGQVLVPFLDKAAKFLTKLIDGMVEGKGVGGALISTFKSWGGALAPVVESVKQIVGWLQKHSTIVKILAIAIGVLTAAIVALNIVMSANPIVLVGLALAALVIGFVTAYRESETFRKIVDAVFAWLKGAVTTVVAAVTTAFNAVKGAISAATSTVVGEVTQWDTLFSAIGRGVDIMVSVVKLGFDTLKAVFALGMAVLGPIVTAAWTLIKGIFSAQITAIKGVVQGGFDVIRGVIKIIGGLFKGDFRQMWDGVKTIFTGGIKALKGILEGAWKLLKAPVEALAAGLRDAFKHSWDRIKDVFSSAINVVIGFLNVLISAINAIPGVPDIPKIGKLGGGGGGSNIPVDKKARGGAYARTGGLVNAPITLMGEEAPRHPEFVIPTNPAYRGRAKGLLAQAAGAIGMQAGGRWGIGALGGLWERAGGAHSLARTMAIISSAESGVAGSYGYQFARNPSGATGLWQILGQLVPGDLTNAMVNARNAVAKYKLQGLGAWTASKSVWGPLVGNFPGTAGPVGAPVDLESILSKFPSPSKLPDMFQGLGKYVIGKATSYVKKQIGGLFTGGGNLGNKGTASGLSLGVQKAIELASGMGWAYPSPGQLTGGRHAKGSLHYSGRAVDFGTAGHSGGQVMGLWQALLDKFGLGGLNELFYDPAGRYIDNHHWVSGAIGGHGDHIHAGFRKGGKWLGSFKRGGITSSEGLAHLHANEAVIPLKKGGRHVTRDSTSVFGRQNKVPFRGSVDRRLINPPKGVIRPFDPVTSTVPEAAVATEENTSATDALTEATNRLIELNAQVAANQLKILALTNQGPQILAAVVAAVSGGIGGRTGLGFQSPSYAGGMARYR